MSPAMASHERELKRFLYRNLYYHEEQLATAERAQQVIAGLFASYHHNPQLLPPGWVASLPEAEPARSRHIADFIAGMTDRFALAEHRRLFDATPDLR